MAVPPDDRGRGCALPQPTTGGTTSHTYLVPEKSLASTLRAPTTSTFSVMVVAEGTPPTEPLPDDRRRALMTKKGAHRQRGVAGELLLARMRSMFYFRETAATAERGECSVKKTTHEHRPKVYGNSTRQEMGTEATCLHPAPPARRVTCHCRW